METERPLFFVGPWDLDRRLPVIPDDPAAGPVVLIESVAKGRALPWHRQKLVMVLSALHHFAEELRGDGYEVLVLNAPSYVEGLRRAIAQVGATRVVAMQPREWGLQRALEAADLDVPLTLHPDGGPGGHFLLDRHEFVAWAQGRKQLRMDVFYRWMRKRTGILLDDAGKPVGGRWSLDADNRRHARGQAIPELPRHAPDALTRDIMTRVAGWSGRWGRVEGFAWPVTREGALAELDHFVRHRLSGFGDFQDAMLDDSPFLWHARIAPAMNLSLLHPREVVRAAIDAYARGEAPLNAVEGFVRQIIGWREFIRGVYWLRMPAMRQANALRAERPLPDFFWDPDKTDMRCMQQAIGAVRDHGYAHHIQRLMVLGNFALLAGIRPLDVSHWFWAGYVDAFEWVQLPNVHGMALYADTAFTTKPYAASGSYIHRMSDHCRGCRYDVKARHTDDACPFNALYWHFMVRHRERLARNPRLGVLYRSWDRYDDTTQRAILERADRWLANLRPARHGWTFEDDGC